MTLVYGSSLLAAFLGGILALFAPCCIVSMLPAYLAATLKNSRWRLVPLTGLFALGISLVLLPFTLGIGGLSQLFSEFHREIFFLGGVFLILLGLMSLAGKSWALPMPMMRTPTLDVRDTGSVLMLGVFSGVASSCCAPVLAGVLALSALSASMVGSLGLGLAYVFGMVFPLFLAALFWDRLNLGDKWFFRGAMVQWSLNGRAFRMRPTDLAAGILFLVMGGFTVYLGLSGQTTFTPEFLLAFNLWLNRMLGALAEAAKGVPDYVVALGLLGLVIGLAWVARVRPVPASHRSGSSGRPSDADAIGENE